MARPGGRQRSLSFVTQQEAQRFLRGLKVDLDRGRYEAPHTGNLLFAEWSDRLMAGLVIKPWTRESYESLLRLHINPTFSARRLRSIKRVDVQQWVTGPELSPARAGQAYRVLARILSEAVASDVLTKSPARGVRLPRVTPKSVVPLSVEELRVWRSCVVSLWSAGG